MHFILYLNIIHEYIEMEFTYLFYLYDEEIQL